MDDYFSAEEEDCYYSSDQESLDGIDNEESELHPLSSKKSNTQVRLYTLSFLSCISFFLIRDCVMLCFLLVIPRFLCLVRDNF